MVWFWPVRTGHMPDTLNRVWDHHALFTHNSLQSTVLFAVICAGLVGCIRGAARSRPHWEMEAIKPGGMLKAEESSVGRVKGEEDADRGAVPAGFATALDVDPSPMPFDKVLLRRKARFPFQPWPGW